MGLLGRRSRLSGRASPVAHRRFGVSDMVEIRRIIFGDNDRIPIWAGYTFGYRIVTRYLQANPDVRPASLVGLPASAIYEGSGYDPRVDRDREGEST